MLKLFFLGLLSLGYGFALVPVLDALIRRSEPQLSRKFFHAAVFTGAVPAQLGLGFWGVVVYGTVMAGFVLLSVVGGTGSRLYQALAGGKDGESTRRLILLPLFATALGGLIAVLLVGEFAVVGYLVCGWGDAAAALVGTRWGRRRYSVPLFSAPGHSRSLEGSAAALAAGCLGGWVALTLLGYPQPLAAGVGLACGCAGAVVEGLSGRGSDNFWMQVVPALVATRIVG
jgi:dolichol kinase